MLIVAAPEVEEVRSSVTPFMMSSIELFALEYCAIYGQVGIGRREAARRSEIQLAY